jgi:hypothetical protein
MELAPFQIVDAGKTWAEKPSSRQVKTQWENGHGDRTRRRLSRSCMWSMNARTRPVVLSSSSVRSQRPMLAA